MRNVYVSNYCCPEFGVSPAFNGENRNFIISVYLQFRQKCYFLSTSSFIKENFENKYNPSYNVEFLKHISRKHSSSYLKRVLITKFDSCYYLSCVNFQIPFNIELQNQTIISCSLNILIIEHFWNCLGNLIREIVQGSLQNCLSD